jgi:hypothetical protein
MTDEMSVSALQSLKPNETKAIFEMNAFTKEMVLATAEGREELMLKMSDQHLIEFVPARCYSGWKE